MSSLTREKLNQAVSLVPRSGADVWLTFVRETSMMRDPVLPLILNGGLTWESAFIVARDGRKVAVVGNYDADPLIASGDWDEVVPYVHGIWAPLLETLEKLVPPGGKIAVNTSPDNVAADGLTHGMFLKLQEILAGTRFSESLVSAAETVTALRSQKTPAELARIRTAIAQTDAAFAEIAAVAKVGRTEREVYDHVHRWVRDRGYGFSWDPAGDPIVNSGPDSMIGHGIPSASIRIAPGHIFHVDLGLIVDEYASDIQRCWYVPAPGETAIPPDLEAALSAVTGAISAGSKALRPGVRGHEVDAAARSFLVAQGYPEYLHALGHQVGRTAHDGGAILGPRWERYGRTPDIPIEAGEVYTLELGVTVPNRGYLGIEEMVVVAESGCEFPSNRQMDIPLLC